MENPNGSFNRKVLPIRPSGEWCRQQWNNSCSRQHHPNWSCWGLRQLERLFTQASVRFVWRPAQLLESLSNSCDWDLSPPPSLSSKKKTSLVVTSTMNKSAPGLMDMYFYNFVHVVSDTVEKFTSFQQTSSCQRQPESDREKKVPICSASSFANSSVWCTFQEDLLCKFLITYTWVRSKLGLPLESRRRQPQRTTTPAYPNQFRMKILLVTSVSGKRESCWSKF